MIFPIIFGPFHLKRNPMSLQLLSLIMLLLQHTSIYPSSIFNATMGKNLTISNSTNFSHNTAHFFASPVLTHPNRTAKPNAPYVLPTMSSVHFFFKRPCLQIYGLRHYTQPHIFSTSDHPRHFKTQHHILSCSAPNRRMTTSVSLAVFATSTRPLPRLTNLLHEQPNVCSSATHLATRDTVASTSLLDESLSLAMSHSTNLPSHMPHNMSLTHHEPQPFLIHPPTMMKILVLYIHSSLPCQPRHAKPLPYQPRHTKPLPWQHVLHRSLPHQSILLQLPPRQIILLPHPFLHHLAHLPPTPSALYHPCRRHPLLHLYRLLHPLLYQHHRPLFIALEAQQGVFPAL